MCNNHCDVLDFFEYKSYGAFKLFVKRMLNCQTLYVFVAFSFKGIAANKKLLILLLKTPILNNLGKKSKLKPTCLFILSLTHSTVISISQQ